MSAPRVVEGWLRVTAYLHAGRPRDGHLLATQILGAGADHGLAGGAVFAGVHGYSVRYEQHKPAHQRNWGVDQPVMVAMVGPAPVVESFLPRLAAIAPRTLVVTDRLTSVRLYGTAAAAPAE